MKRIVLFLLFACNAIHAQEKGDIEIGLSAGLNSSHATSFNQEAQNTKLGLNVSLSAEYYISEAWGFKTRLAYDQKGWTNVPIDTENTRSIKDYNVNYVTVPFLFTHHAGSARNFHMHLGPYIGILLGAEGEATGLDLTYVFHKIDLGISYALGYKVNLNEHIKIFTELEISPG